MYVYIYIYTCVCVYICIDTGTYIYARIDKHELEPDSSSRTTTANQFTGCRREPPCTSVSNLMTVQMSHAACLAHNGDCWLSRLLLPENVFSGAVLFCVLLSNRVFWREWNTLR